jgi:cytochrome c2
MAGYDTVRTYGCFGCHEVVGFDGPAKRIGPDMRLEPNYFAAGLQLAHLTTLREQALEERMKALENGGDAAKAEFDAITVNLGTLAQAKQLGETLGSETWNSAARQRLKQIVDEDRVRLADYEAAVAAGEKVEPYYPAFTPESYQTASVLKDEEMPGQYRKVGPALRYLATKVDRTWLDDWLHDPQHFRPSTRMPKFFGLFDHLIGADEKATEKMHEHTADLELVEIQGLRQYLLQYSQPFNPLGSTETMAAAAIADGDAERGKLLFEVGGCLACHSNKDFPGHGVQGPDLTGAGSKFVGEKGRDWLYGWIENPKRYHARTKMPVVPLKARPGNENTDPIADVVAYLQADKAEWWKPFDPDGKTNEKTLDALAYEHLSKAFFATDAREYLRIGIPESRRSELKGAEIELLVSQEDYDNEKPLSEERKLLYVGNKTVGKYGCYACHDIPGFEDAKPIGTALSDWGRKDPSRLAFEHIDHYVGHSHGGHGAAHGAAGTHHGGVSAGDAAAITTGDSEAHGHEPAEDGAGMHAPAADTHATVSAEDEAFFAGELHHHSRIGFIHQKLREPRSFDYKKTEDKPYNDRLRMPLFPLSHQQHEEVITFVLGLVADPPSQQFVYQPSPRAQAINEGRRVLEQFNCAACHQLSEEKWDISFPADWDRLSDPPTPDAFPFVLPHFTREEIQTSEEVSRSGRQTASLIGRAKRKANGDYDVFAYDKDEDDYLSLGELEAEEFPVDSLAYRFELYSPALLDGRRFMPKDPVPVIPLNVIKERIARQGGDLAHYLLPRALAIADPANQQKGEEAWGWVPPTLVGEGNKVQPDWLHSFLLEPYPIRPAVVLNMPKFNMSNASRRAISHRGARTRCRCRRDLQRQSLRRCDAHRHQHCGLREVPLAGRLCFDRRPAGEGARFDPSSSPTATGLCPSLDRQAELHPAVHSDARQLQVCSGHRAGWLRSKRSLSRRQYSAA